MFNDISKMFINEKMCKSCSKPARIYVSCLECDTVYHPKCLSTIPDLFVSEEGYVFCCCILTSKCTDPSLTIARKDMEIGRCKEKQGTPPKQELLNNPIIKEECIDDYETHVGEELSNYYKIEDTKNLGDDVFQFSEPKIEIHTKNEDVELNDTRDLFSCNFCNMRVLHEKDYEEHIKKCRMKYLDLNEHQYTAEENGTKWKCTECNFSTKCNHQLELNSKKFSCSDCSYATSHKDSLTKHILLKHSNEAKKYKCDQCDYATHLKGNLTRHACIHTNERLFKCLVCQTSFRQRSNLISHLKVHDMERKKKFKCQQCNHSYYNKNGLVYHMKTKHLIAKKYECGMCSYSAAHKCSLDRHILVKHSDEAKKYKCEQCDYSTHVKASLKGHFRIHTNEKPFKCPYEDCNFKFRLITQLKRHIQSCHILVKSFKCDQCDYKCVQESQLKIHIQRVHFL